MASVAVLKCHTCLEDVDPLMFWKQEREGEVATFCALHRPQEAGCALVLAGAGREVGDEDVHGGVNGVMADLKSAEAETSEARSQLQALRSMLEKAAPAVPETSLGARAEALAPGDKTELVLARSLETGARTERQLVGLKGGLRLTEKGKEGGVPLWSVAPGKLVSLRASAAPTAGMAFHLHFEGPHSELQVWCRSAAQMDAWVAWVRQHAPQCQVSRVPALGEDSSSSGARLRPQPSRGSVRSRLQKSVSRSSLREDPAAEDSASSRQSESRNNSPSGTLDRKFGKGMFQWAKKLYDKVEESTRTSQAVKTSDVFSTPLEELMQEQLQVAPDEPVPLLMRFLSQEVLRLDGASTEGIFRISAAHDEVAEVVRLIRKVRFYEYGPAVQFKDPHVPAAVLKLWLRDLPVPLFQNYFKCVELAAQEEAPEEQYHDVVAALSQVHRNAIFFLIDFLIALGAPTNVSATKMPIENLALVFVPSFLRCPDESDLATILNNQPLEQAFVQRLFELSKRPGWLVNATGAQKPEDLLNGEADSQNYL